MIEKFKTENLMYDIIDFVVMGDDRGSLVAIENSKNIPFDIKRIYYIYDVNNGIERGFHAHKNLKQIAIAISGKCTFVVDDGNKRNEVVLDNPAKGLYIDGLIWREMKHFSKECTLLVLASDYYDESDYIRNYDEFTNTVRLEGGGYNKL